MATKIVYDVTSFQMLRKNMLKFFVCFLEKLKKNILKLTDLSMNTEIVR